MDGSDDKRKAMGRQRDEASFPVPPAKATVPPDYPTVLSEIRERIQQTRLRTVLAANAGMTLMYWDIGRVILKRQDEQGWGAKVIDRLSADLQQAFPDMRGLSSRNLKYMRAFAAAWTDRAIVQETLAQITWYANIALLEQQEDADTRLWYARKCREHGWSHSILTLQIENALHERQGKAATNFPATLPSAESDMASQVFKDPYLFDFLGTADPRREREVEQALVDHIQKFLLEMGKGFAFVGRQVHLEIEGEDFYLDLIFYHYVLRRFVVIELKAVPFDAAFVGKLNLYLSAVDDLLRQPDDKPTIGLLLCRSKKKLVVEYALRGFQKPIGVAEWQTKLVKTLPKELKGNLPTVEEIEKEMDNGR